MVAVEPRDSKIGLAFTQWGHQSTPNMKNFAPVSKYSAMSLLLEPNMRRVPPGPNQGDGCGRQ